MKASDVIALLSCDNNENDINIINIYDIGIEIFYTNEEFIYIEFSKEN